MLFSKSGSFPNQWATGLIVPMHKKGDVDDTNNDTNNYRGITLVIRSMYNSIKLRVKCLNSLSDLSRVMLAYYRGR